MNIEIKDSLLAELSVEELEGIKKLLCSNHLYEEASNIRAYERHCRNVRSF